MTNHHETKAAIRTMLRERLGAMSDADRHHKSLAACALLQAAPEFQAAGVVMLYLSLPAEVDTACLALRAWQEGKTVVVPRVDWNRKHMLPVEITSLATDGLTTARLGVREPAVGRVASASEIDLVIVPGLGFTDKGHRIGRGMGFYDRFLAQSDFAGTSCGLAFEEQIVPELPMLDHDVPLDMLVTNHGIRRFASDCPQMPGSEPQVNAGQPT